MYGDEHERTLDAMSGLASLRGAMKHYAAALLLEMEVLALRRRVLGHNHLHTLTETANLATIHQNRGDHCARLPLAQEALDGCRRTLGRDHLDTIIYASTLAIPTATSCPGTHLTDWLSSQLGNIAGVHSRLGEHQRALPLRREALEISLRVLGSDHGIVGERSWNHGRTITYM